MHISRLALDHYRSWDIACLISNRESTFSKLERPRETNIVEA